MIGGALSLFDRVLLAEARRHVSIGAGSRLSGRPVLSVEPGSTVRIGERFTAQSRSRHQVLGVAHACTIRTVRAGAELIIGDDVGMSGGSIIAALRVEIGDGVLLGADAMVFDTHFHPVVHDARRYAPMPVPVPADAVRIGSNVFVGTGAVIMPGATLGDDVVVAARAVVRGAVPAGSIVAGVPARVVGSARQDDRAR